MHATQVMAAAAAGKHVYCEKPFTLTKREAEDAVAAVRKAGVTLAVGYNRRFHPEMTKLRDMIRGGELGTILHVEATMTFPNALSINPAHWRADKSGDAAGRPDADGRPRHRRHDRPVRTDRSRFRPELPPRRADRCRRHHLDSGAHERGHVGLSRHHDHDRARFQLSRYSAPRAGCGSKASPTSPALRRRNGARGCSAPASSSR
jgi:hypothetical protein